jgi:hypothetical protein
LSAEWIAAVAALATIAGGVLLFIIRLSVSVSGTLRENSGAIDRLTEYLVKQDKRNDEQDKTLDDHEVRLVEIETVHKVKGCVQ